MKKLLLCWLCGMLLLAGCSAPTRTPLDEPPGQGAPETLNISLLYPTESSAVEMGQSIKTIVRITDGHGLPVRDATVRVTFSDPTGGALGSVPAAFGDGDVYRSESWTIPHRTGEGAWTITVEANAPAGSGRGTGTFPVDFSTSEILYYKYGFWLDAPTLRGIQPTIGAERGDAENGLVRWGGVLPSQHVLPENWVEVQWRMGDFKLDSPEAVRAFLLGDIGDIGFTPVREIGAFERTQFKRWDAWQAPARGQYAYQEMVWTVFYAPEVNKTYALSTTVIQPPTNIDANEFLLEGFDIDPDVRADGVAPAPLVPLLPQPTLVGPESGARFTGLERPILLRWEPLVELAEDEYYQVAVDFNYEETNTLIRYATRETGFTLPEALYRQPNCAVFNWRVTLMQKTGVDEKGDPVGVALSYNSLYRYVQWFYPPDDRAPFDPRCPNAQF